MRALLAVAFCLVLMQPPPVHAVQLDAQGCQVMAIWGRDLIWARDMGADRAKVRAWLEEQRKETPLFSVLLPMFKEIWETKASGVEVMMFLFRDCMARRGAYGTEV